MIIDFNKNQDQIQLFFNHQTESISFDSHKIIFLLWNQKKSINLVFEHNDNIEVFKNEYENCKITYPNQLIFCFEFLGTPKIITKLNTFLSANFLKFCNLKIFWYQIIIQNKIYEENILFDLENGHQIEINSQEPKAEDYIELNLEKEIDLLNEFNLNLELWEKNIKELTLENILLEKKRLLNKYQKFKQYLDSNIEKQQKLETLIENYHSILIKQKTEFKSKRNRDNGKLLKSKIKINNLNSRNIVFSQINKELDSINSEKNKKQEEIESINQEIINKQDYLAKIKQDINRLEIEKNQKYTDIKKGSLNFVKKETTFYSSKNENINNTMQSNIDKSSVSKTNLAVMVHIYKFSLWEEFIEYLDRLNQVKSYFDLYINIAIDPKYNESDIPKLLETVKKYKGAQNIYISYSDNRGLDIGGFIISYLKMLEVGKTYSSIIKIHTKSNKNWRFIMLYSLLGNINIIRNNLKAINSNKIGMIGYQVAGLNYNTNKTVKNYIYEYGDKFKTPKMEGLFIPGTIFWIKSSILKKYFKKPLLISIYNDFKQNYCGSSITKTEGKPHAFERFFGILVENAGFKTIKFDNTNY